MDKGGLMMLRWDYLIRLDIKKEKSPSLFHGVNTTSKFGEMDSLGRCNTMIYKKYIFGHSGHPGS